MTPKNYWLTSGFFTMMHKAIDFLVGFLGFMILVRIYSPESFGIWVLFITIVTIIELSRNGYLQNGLIKFLVSDTNQDGEIQMSSLQQNIILTLILMLSTYALAPYAESVFGAPGLSKLLRIHVYFTPFLIFHTHNLILMQAKFNFRSYFFAGISKTVPFFICISFFYISNIDLDLIQLGWIYNFCYIIALLSSHIQVRKYLNFVWGWNSYWFSKLFHFGIYVFGTNLLSVISSSMDKFLLGALLTPIEVAMANSAGRVTNLLDIPINSIASISFPKASDAHERKQHAEVSKTYELTLGAMLSFSFLYLIAILLFSKTIILFIVGKDYLATVPYLQVISLLALVRPLDRQSGVFLDAIGKPSYNMVLVFTTMLSGALFSWFFISRYGLMGGAYGIMLSLTITAVIKSFILNRFLKINYLNILKQALRNYPLAIRLGWSKIKRKPL
ncbi:oligosaccharide flippase family protein [Algoriphagus sp. Y33]|uniref:oligosaccharide flippase family protein n=1 Tax=Algoriphagus sp. Y33 TaxID=2772483 RepID=UPI00178389C6|nr:oligosaccharide flippase family protein [Algoriphagus sp. Y33]